MENLKGKNVAILATNGFEESELREPMLALKKAGANVDIISENIGKIKGWSNGDWSNEYDVNKTLSEANEEAYNALVLPGGVMNPDTLRQNGEAIRFVKSFFKNKKPVAAICHAPWLLAEADVLSGRRVTSYGSIKRDLVNAGAKWEDSEVVVDEGLITSRSPKDLPMFNTKLVEEVYEGKHELQTA
ncbi:type 1 glutamine amidotransferase domain-containing protein [Psychroserpens sp. XS_ASV72]|uniref:type 1 glutamine amidotransferase domain-containing protein n=1 Tax=Psychroserpens sp. XS_ASV72 TaxID=3241293 RepID=UPI003513C2B6